MQQRLNADTHDNRPPATDVAYAPKLREFLGFCEHFYSGNAFDGTSKHTVTAEKLFKFLFYQAYREQRKKGRKKKSKKQKDDNADGDEAMVDEAGTTTVFSKSLELSLRSSNPPKNRLAFQLWRRTSPRLWSYFSCSGIVTPTL